MLQRKTGQKKGNRPRAALQLSNNQYRYQSKHKHPTFSCLMSAPKAPEKLHPVSLKIIALHFRLPPNNRAN
jgi:hypothetical protein